MHGSETLRLDDQLCFALYAATNAITRAYRPPLDDIGLTYPQYLALMALWEEDGLSVSDVAERLQLPGHALTPLLVRLERLGFLTRSRSSSDRRVVVVHLTQRGADMEHEAAAAQRRVVCRTGLDEAALADLRAQLHDLVSGMESRDTDRRREGAAS